MAFSDKQILEDILTGKTLKSIQFFHIDEQCTVADPGKAFLVDVGIQLTLDSQNIFIGWNTEKELIDTIIGSVKDIATDIHFHELEIQESSKFEGQKISAVTIKWNWYQDLDDNLELIETLHYIPLELVIEFENNSKLQIASIAYMVENGEVGSPVFDSQGELLISIDAEVDIALHDHEH